MKNTAKMPLWPLICSLLTGVVGTTGAATDDAFGDPGALGAGHGAADYPQLAELVDPGFNFRLAAEASGGGASSTDELAKKLANPIAAMISVPFQNNFDYGAGPDGDGVQWKLNIQPVIPLSLNKDWNLITRFILPVIYQNDVGGTKGSPSGQQFGLADTVVSAWFTPKKPTSGGWIWGVGPVLYLPTGTDYNSGLGVNQWGGGATALALRQQGHFTYGMMMNHIWGIDDSGNGIPSLSNTFLQPFFNYIPGGGWTYALNTESTYNWRADKDEFTMPINATVKKMFKICDQHAQWEFGGRYYAVAPDHAPDWGLRMSLTLLFPK